MDQNLSEEESFQFYFKVQGEEKRKMWEKKNASKELWWIQAGLAFMG